MRGWFLLGLCLSACSDAEPPASEPPGAPSPSSPSPSPSPTPSATTGAVPEVPPPESIQLDVPWIAQKPELPRGCEVTSLGMMLRYAGLEADKMTLAKEIDKVPFKQGSLYGDPNDGFVGNMYTFAEKGYGAYHAPVERIAEKYLPGKVVKLTGSSFDDLLYEHVGRKQPVWIITNAKWRKLQPDEMETWKTKNGDVLITWHEHSVVITGYDPQAVYINDPLDTKTNKKLDRTKFREAWEQMGKQAIAFLP